MPLTEFVFKVRSDKNLLCEFTKQHRQAMVVVHLLRADASEQVPGAIYTVLAPRAEWEPLLAQFAQAYGEHEVLAQHDTHVSVRAALKLDYTRGHNPINAVFQVLGRDCWFHPIVVQDGYLHISVVSPNEEGRERFLGYVKRMREHVHPDDFRLLHVGPYAPPALAPAREGLTPGQDEVLKMAIALGYYDTPRGCTIEDLAEAFGVSKAAAHKRLKAAENKVIHEYAGGTKRA